MFQHETTHPATIAEMEQYVHWVSQKCQEYIHQTPWNTVYTHKKSLAEVPQSYQFRLNLRIKCQCWINHSNLKCCLSCKLNLRTENILCKKLLFLKTALILFTLSTSMIIPIISMSWNVILHYYFCHKRLQRYPSTHYSPWEVLNIQKKEE